MSVWCQQRKFSTDHKETAISFSTIGPPSTANTMNCLPPGPGPESWGAIHSMSANLSARTE